MKKRKRIVRMSHRGGDISQMCADLSRQLRAAHPEWRNCPAQVAKQKRIDKMCGRKS